MMDKFHTGRILLCALSFLLAFSVAFAQGEELSDVAVMRIILNHLAGDHLTSEDMAALAEEIGLRVAQDTEVAGSLPQKDHLISYEWINDRFILLTRQLPDGSIRAVNVLVIGQEIRQGDAVYQTNADMLAFICDELERLEEQSEKPVPARSTPTEYRVWQFGQGKVYIASDEGSPFHQGEIWLYAQYN